MMKKYLFSVALALSMALTAQAQYKITAHLDSIPDGMAYLKIDGQTPDSAVVKNGKFVIKSKRVLECPAYVSVTDDKSWGFALWMGNDNVTVSSDPKSKELIFKGSPTQAEYEAFSKYMKPTFQKGEKMMASITTTTSAEDADRIEKEYRQIEDEAFAEFVKKYPSSYICLNNVYNMRVLYKYPVEKYTKYLNMLTPGAFKGQQWNTLQHIMQKDIELEPGHAFPSFEMKDAYGKQHSLAEFKGKYVLFTISSYGLPEYKKDLALRRSLYEAHQKEGLEMLDYLMTQELVDVIKPVANFGLKWKFLADLKGWDNPWLKEHEIDHITQNFLIDKNGVVIAKNLYGDDLKREIDKLF